jgi:outer membrane protein insertion porin family
MTDRMPPSTRSPSRSRLFRFAPASFAVALAVQAGVVVAQQSNAPQVSVEPFTIKDIRVEGLQRTDAGTVFAALPFRIGDTYTADKGAAALRALFATGLFKDVRIDIESGVAVVIVEERPVIANIDFVGMKEFEKDALVKSLKDFGIGEGLPFDKSLADRAEQELKRQYLTRSLYGAEVVTTVTPQERNRVNVTFTVTEGSPSKIREIRIVGNKVFSEGTLKGLFELNDGGWLNFYLKGDRYSRAKLNADLETLRAYYQNRGYLEFEVVSTQVAISPDKQDITITINVKEGQPFTVTAVNLEGEYFGKEEEFRSLVTIRPGQAYRAESVAETSRAFVDRFGAFGYAFAKVDSRPDIDRATGQVSVTLIADPQRRVYVRRISVAGNTRTRDEVVRREFRQFESAWYDGRKIKLSRDRVDRLGYFTDVSVDSTEVPGTSDQVDLTISVKEKPTGSISVGAGFSSADKLSLSASIKQENIFGSGNYLGLEINTSKYSRTAVVSTVDPYFTVDGISRAIDVYYRTTRPINPLGGEDYELVTPGASIRFGVPFSEYDTVFFGVGVERTEIKGTSNLPNSFFLYREQFGETSTSTPLTIGWTRDNRDSALVPTDGRYTRVNVDYSPLGDARYVRVNLQGQQYIPITRAFTFGVNAEIGYGAGLGGRPYPIFKNFYGGGLGTVRGFEQASLGPVDVTGAYIGGNRRLNINNELYLPVPGANNDRTLRIFLYLDAGNVWGENEHITLGSIRASAGFGVSWISPVGPLKLSYGLPIRKMPEDRIQHLQFQIGTAF